VTELQERLIEQEFGMVASADDAGTGTGSALQDICRSVGDLVGVARWPLRRMSVQVSCARVELEWAEPHAVLATGVVPTGPAVAMTVAPDDPAQTCHRVCAPLVGTFYRAPEPGAPPFVQAGDLVQPGQQIGIVEAMKLMNPVEADVTGRVVEVLVGDAEPVEYGQPLVLVEPLEPGDPAGGQ